MSTASPFQSAEINQAAGMVSVQANCVIEDALQLMEDRAAVQGMTLQEVAIGVLDRSVRFGE